MCRIIRQIWSKKVHSRQSIHFSHCGQNQIGKGPRPLSSIFHESRSDIQTSRRVCKEFGYLRWDTARPHPQIVHQGSSSLLNLRDASNTSTNMSKSVYVNTAGILISANRAGSFTAGGMALRVCGLGMRMQSGSDT